MPLDLEARVLDPGDLPAQTRHVASHIREILSRVGMTAGMIGKLVLYYVGGPEDEAAMLAAVREAFGDTPLLVPVPVPHFYYEGLLVEVDVFAADPVRRLANGPVEAEDLVWSVVEIDPSGAPTEATGFSSDRLLADHWFLPENHGGSIAGLASDPGAAVLTTGGKAFAELTFANEPVSLDRTRAEGVEVIVRRAGRHLWASGRAAEGETGLVAQTRRIMKAIDAALIRHGFCFADVVKSTTHYAGGSSEEELHENMGVRNAYYGKPGPASTGIPVLALAAPDSHIAVDLLAVR